MHVSYAALCRLAGEYDLADDFAIVHRQESTAGVGEGIVVWMIGCRSFSKHKRMSCWSSSRVPIADPTTDS